MTVFKIQNFAKSCLKCRVAVEILVLNINCDVKGWRVYHRGSVVMVAVCSECPLSQESSHYITGERVLTLFLETAIFFKPC